jgi:acetoin utilization deacetylase AcuC-like enzyme
LHTFSQNQSVGLKAINTRVGAAITGAYEATKAYVEGDLEMVQTYQKNAAVAADPPLHGAPRQLGGY